MRSPRGPRLRGRAPAPRRGLRHGAARAGAPRRRTVRTRHRCPRSTDPSRSPRSRAGATIASPTRGPPFASAARAIAGRETASRALWEPSCAAADSVDPRDGAAVRAFFEVHFSPYQVMAADGRDGRHDHRLLRAAARGQPHADRPLRGAAVRRARRSSHRRPDGALPGAQGQAGARPRRGKKGRALLAARRHRARKGTARRQDTRLRRGSGRCVLPADPGLRSRAARRRRHRARRLRGPERPPVPLGRARPDRPRRACARARLDAGDPRVGAAASGRTARAARRESELRVLPRGARTRAGDARGRDRRSDRHARRPARGAAARSPSIRARFRSARRCSSRPPTRCRRGHSHGS